MMYDNRYCESEGPGWMDGYVEFTGQCVCPDCGGRARSHDNKNGYTCMECGSKKVGA